VRSTQLKALDEILTLIVEDPYIRSTLAEYLDRRLRPKYGESDVLIATSKVFFSVDSEATKIHDIWAGVYKRTVFTTGMYSGMMQEPFEEMLGFISHPKYSFLAARHLNRGIKSFMRGELRTGTRHFSALERFLEEYLEVAAAASSSSDSHLIEWSNLESCIQVYHRQHFTPMNNEHGVAQRYITGMARSLIRKAEYFPNTFSTYFSAPTIEFHLTNEVRNKSHGLGGKFSFTSVHGSDWNLDSVTVSRFVLNFFQNLTDSEDIGVHLAFVRNLDNPTRRFLRGTILVNEVMVTYCHLAHYANGSYPGLGVGNGFFRQTGHRMFSACASLASYLDSEDIEVQALATFVVARFIAIDRY